MERCCGVPRRVIAWRQNIHNCITNKLRIFHLGPAYIMQFCTVLARAFKVVHMWLLRCRKYTTRVSKFVQLCIFSHGNGGKLGWQIEMRGCPREVMDPLLAIAVDPVLVIAAEVCQMFAVGFGASSTSKGFFFWPA